MQVIYIIISTAVLMGLSACSTTQAADEGNSSFSAETELDRLTEKALTYLAVLPVDSNAIPRALRTDGSLHGTGSRDWTSGFYPGQLWLLYEHSGEQQLKTAAEQWTSFIEKEKHDTHTHDLGFKLYCSFGQGYRLTGKEDYRQVIIQASETLSKRYNDQVGCIRSWDFNADIWKFPVIIDNMLNLEMLFTASRLGGDTVFHRIAHRHAATTLDNHIRKDHSAYHVIDFDPKSGQQRLKDTHQGAAVESSWARGQAWNLYGFTVAYRETGDPSFLKQARGVAEYIYQHPQMPNDLIPYWDFEAPHIPNEPRDASAAAINASALLMLAGLDPENQKQYLEWADATLASLSQPEYESDTPPFLLKHSVGSVPGGFEVDVPIVYADYYYVEALMRRASLAKS